MKKIAVSFALIVLFCKLLIAQDVNHLFRPYGFQLTSLKSGEFFISLSGTNLSSDYFYEYYSNDIEAKSKHLRLSGSILSVLAITENILIRLNIRYYPIQKLFKYFRNSYSDKYEYTTEVKQYLFPEFGLLFRPTLNLER